MIEFDAKDVEAVCDAVIFQCEVTNDNGPNYCRYCYEDNWSSKRGIEHKTDCPVLIAKDLSTNL